MSTNIPARPAVNQSGAPVNALAVQQPQQNGLIPDNLPSFLTSVEKGKTGTELMQRYIVPPRLKLVQGQSGQELKQQFGESATIIQPDKTMITPPINFRGGAQEGEAILCIPVFFWPEFTLMNPYGVANLPFIRGRSTDSQSYLARRCRDTDFDRRKEVCPEAPNEKIKYTEVMNFMIQILAPVYMENLVVVSLHTGGFKDGSDWCKLIKQVKSKNAQGETTQIPCWAQYFTLSVVPRKKDKMNWYGYQVRASINPETNLRDFVIDEPTFRNLESAHDMLEANYLDGLLQPEYEDDTPTTNDANTVDTTATPVNRF